MELPIDKNIPLYISDAIVAFEQIMVGNKYSMLEKITRFTKGEFFVLKVLLKSDGVISPSELSEIMNSSKGRISAILKSLEKKGEISREIDKDNRRNILVTITDAGRKHVMSELMSSYHIMVKSFENMGEEDTKEFVRLTQKMVKNMEEAFNKCD